MMIVRKILLLSWLLIITQWVQALSPNLKLLYT